MEVAVIGAGHVGLVTAASLAKAGHVVTCLERDPARLADLAAGRLPFYEEGLQALVDEGRRSERLCFTGDPAAGLARSDVIFICVGTPGRDSSAPDLVAVEVAAEAVGRHARRPTGRPVVVVEKSTVPVQTGERVAAVLQRCGQASFHVVSNPEFLREGRAVQDVLHPARILVGADCPEAHRIMETLYEPLIRPGTRYFMTDLATAELAKHACNAFLALKVSYINGVARICEAAGADVAAIADIMGADPRIGRDFLDAGLGWGGSCFPKDIAAFKEQCRRLGYRFGLLDEVVALNEEAIEAAFGKIEDALWNVAGKRVVLLGLSFKPGTDDVRESPALRLAARLLNAGASVVGCDPLATGAAAVELPGLEVGEDVYRAAEGSDCLVVCTPWPEYAGLNLARLKAVMRVPILVDGRNLFDPQALIGSGFSYIGTGRPAA